MKKTRIGLEITENNLHLALVEKNAKGWKLIESAIIEIKAGNLPNTLSQTRKLIPRRFKEVILSTTYSQVLMKEVSVDSSFTTEEIYQYLVQQSADLFGKTAGVPAEGNSTNRDGGSQGGESEARGARILPLHSEQSALPMRRIRTRKRFPLPLAGIAGKTANDWSLDFEPSLVKASHELTKKFRVVAIPKVHIKEWVKFCSEYGFEIKVIDVDILALSRLVPTLEYGQPEQALALLWVKEQEFIFIATFKGQLIYVKTAPLQPHFFKETVYQILQFYHGLFPDWVISEILLIDRTFSLDVDGYKIKPAKLNFEIWQTHHTITAASFCSLGLAIYGN